MSVAPRHPLCGCRWPTSISSRSRPAGDRFFATCSRWAARARMRQTLSRRLTRPMAPITTITAPMPTMAPGPSRDQLMLKPMVSLAMTSPARTMATSPATMADAVGPLGRAGGVTLSCIGLPAGLDCVTRELSSIVLILHHGELSDADSGIDDDFWWPVADEDRPGYV